jgi:hypothetical protein
MEWLLLVDNINIMMVKIIHRILTHPTTTNTAKVMPTLDNTAAARATNMITSIQFHRFKDEFIQTSLSTGLSNTPRHLLGMKETSTRTKTKQTLIRKKTI